MSRRCPPAVCHHVMARAVPKATSRGFALANVSRPSIIARDHHAFAGHWALSGRPLLYYPVPSSYYSSQSSPGSLCLQRSRAVVNSPSKPASCQVQQPRNHVGDRQLRWLSSQASGENEATKPTPQQTAPVLKTTTTLLKSLTPHENIYTIPNILTFSRLLAAPAVGYCILNAQPHLALALFFYAGVTDAIDGYLARRFNQTTVVGTVIDPMADKALMTIAVVALAMQHSIPLYLAVIIIGRDVCLAISAIYFRYISLPPPKTFARYWDFSLPSAEVHPTEISKINTLLQLLLIGSAMALPVLRESAPILTEAWNLGGVFEGWSYLVGATTVWSGLSYIGNKDAVKILTKQQIDEKMEERGREE